MKQEMTNCLIRLNCDETGQGLAEYVLLFGLISFAASAGMKDLAVAISAGFIKIAAIFAGHIG